MKRYHQVPRKSNLAAKDKYGPGILTLHLKEGKEKVIYLPPFRHPSSVIRYLVSQEIPFDNYAPWQGLHPGYHFVCIKSFFHQHADDPLLLPDVGQ